jgi:hypothetical protein
MMGVHAPPLAGFYAMTLVPTLRRGRSICCRELVPAASRISAYLPTLTWNEMFAAIDRMSRDGRQATLRSTYQPLSRIVRIRRSPSRQEGRIHDSPSRRARLPQFLAAHRRRFPFPPRTQSWPNSTHQRAARPTRPIELLMDRPAQPAKDGGPRAPWPTSRRH